MHSTNGDAFPAQQATNNATQPPDTVSIATSTSVVEVKADKRLPTDFEVVIVPNTKSSAADEGPLLLALLMGNNNNNAQAQAQAQAPNPPADTVSMSTSISVVELKADIIDSTTIYREEILETSLEQKQQAADDGPLILTLLLTNQNQNQSQSAPVADTVQILNSSSVLELKADPKYSIHLVPEDVQGIHAQNDKFISQDGPILLTLLLTNQNNNVQAAKDLSNPVPDTVQVLRSSSILELKPKSDNINMLFSQDVPDMSFPEESQHFFEEALLTSSITTRNDTANNQNTLLLSGLPVMTSNPFQIADTSAQSIINVLKPKNKPSAHGRNTGLTEEQSQFWKQNGYLVIENALEHALVNEMLTAVTDTARRLFEPHDLMRTHHAIHDKDPCPNPNGRLIATLVDDSIEKNQHLEPLQRIRRMGVGVHRVLPSFRSAIFSESNHQIARSLGFEDPRVTQSLIIAKPSKTGAGVVPHQDGCSNFTDPPGSATFWYALQDAYKSNGCLKVIPGSHRTEPMVKRCTGDAKGYAEFTDLPTPLYAGDPNIKDYVEPKRDSNGDYIWESLEVKAGTLVLMHGNLLHASDANHSSQSRVAFNFGVVEGGLPWPKDAYLQPCEGETGFEKLEPKH